MKHVRETALSQALMNAALRIQEKRRAGTIANQVIWRHDNTDAGLVHEPGLRHPRETPRHSQSQPKSH